jgi:hypothetical protein
LSVGNGSTAVRHTLLLSLGPSNRVRIELAGKPRRPFSPACRSTRWVNGWIDANQLTDQYLIIHQCGGIQ